MEQNFKIKNGSITFSEKGIVISDDFIKQYIINVSSHIITALSGVVLISNYRLTDHQLSLWAGTSFILLGLFNILFMTLRRTNKKHIENREVESMVLKKRFSTVFLNIRLNNGKLRRVQLKKEVPEDIIQIIATFN